MRKLLCSFLIVFLSVAVWSQETQVILDYYEKILPKQYIEKIKLIKIEGRGSKRLEQFEYLLNSADSPEGLLNCVGSNYESISPTELQVLLKRMKKILIKAAKKIDCNAKQSNISLDKLFEVHKTLRRDKILNNPNPEGFCFERAYLISKRLDDLGIKSEQILVNDNIIAAVSSPLGFRAESYPLHIANLVTSTNIITKIEEKYVLDPIYFDEPIPLEQYKNLVLLKQGGGHIQIKNQSYNYSDSEEKSEERTKDTPGDERCQYSDFLLEEARQNIIHSQQQLNQDKEIPSYKYYPTKEAAIESLKKQLIP